MAYFLKEKSVGVLVSPEIVHLILNSEKVNDLDIFIIRFKFLDNEYKVLVDSKFADSYALNRESVLDLEKEYKEEVFFELKPVPQSLFNEFIKMNNISF